MDHALPSHTLQLQTRIDALPDGSGQLELRLVELSLPQPGEDEVLLRVEASPINPSDIGLLFGAADLSQLQASGRGSHALLRAPVPAAAMKAMAGRLGQALPAGNEGAGTVVATGRSAAARALEGRRVAALAGAFYGQHRVVKAEQCLLLPDGASAAQGAACFVNPLTALGMVETMKREGHQALVHTAAASNLGQMLQKLCAVEGIGLVNIVRSAEQAALLRGIGAAQVVDSSAEGFEAALVEALVATGATLAFDATGGGPLAGQILAAMEAALARRAPAGSYSRYGSPVHKQVYLYGMLDSRPVTFNRSFGMAWGMGGWLLFPFLERIGPLAVQALKRRVADELHTTFASHFSRTLSLAQMLQPEHVAAYTARHTGAKFLVDPSL